MSTPIKRIEKEFFLKVLYDDQIPVIYLKGQTQYVFMVEKPTKQQMFFKVVRPVEGLKAGKKLNFMFDFRGQIITFSAEIFSISREEDHIVTEVPELLYKNLDRSFARVSTPRDLQVQFSFHEDRYSLSYPKITEYESLTQDALLDNLNLKNLNDLIAQMGAMIKNYASDYKLVMFKDSEPSTTEEHLLAETGKAFYLPSTLESLPEEDPYPKKRIITEDIFKRYLETIGVEYENLDKACAEFITEKLESGIFSDIWMPILFQEYVIGYVHAWTSTVGMPPFDFGMVDTLFQFSKILAASLKFNNFFEEGKLENVTFEGRIIDISVSGFLFTYPISPFSSMLLPDSELSVRLSSPRRTVNATARIIRHYRDNTQGYFGCHFTDMEIEDIRFLFEYIYNKTFTDKDAAFLTGRV